MVLKSVARYLADQASIDLDAVLAYRPNEAQARDAGVVVSSGNVGDLSPIVDLVTSAAFATGVGDNPCFIGVQFQTQRAIDAVRYYWPAGSTAPTVKLQTFDGTTWADVAGSNSFALVTGWNTLRLGVGAYAKGVRVVYVSGGSAVQLRCSELEAYVDLRIEPRPSDWAAGGIFVLHPDLDLSTMQASVVTVGALPLDEESGETGGGTRLEHAMVVVGLHCSSEDVLDRWRRWAVSVLNLSSSPDRDGLSTPGLPLRGIGYPLTPIAGGSWWTGQQGGWFASPAPTVTVGGVSTAPQTIDYVRGRVEMPGVASTADVRADFTCGVWSFGVTNVQRAVVETPAQLLHRHNAYLLLESDAQFRDTIDAVA